MTTNLPSDRHFRLVLRRALLNATVVVAALVVGLCIAEIALRLIGFSYPPFHQPDSITGLSLRPNTSGWYRKEGQAYVATNSQGLRDRERPIAKPPGTYRVAILGDSMSEALQVDVERTFWRLLEQRLEACGFRSAKHIDVINLGVSGFGTGQALRILQTRGLAYQPDLVILAFFPGNDVRNNSRELEPDKMRPFYVLDAAGGLRLDDTFARSTEFRRRTGRLRRAGKSLSRYLRTLQLIYYVKDLRDMKREQADAAATPAAGAPAPARPVGEVGLDDQIFRDPQDQKWQDAWRLTERLILELKQTAASARAEFAVVIMSIGIQVHPDKVVREAFARRLGVEDLSYPERRLVQFGERTNTRVISLVPDLQRHAERNNVYLHGFTNTSLGSGHLNEAGHAADAEIIGTRLCRG